MKHEQSLLSEYISEGGGYTASVNRITLNGNTMYQVVKNNNVLGYYDTEDEAEAIAEEEKKKKAHQPTIQERIWAQMCIMEDKPQG